MDYREGREQAVESGESVFAELPAALVDEVLRSTERLSRKLLGDLESVRAQQEEMRRQLTGARLLCHSADLPSPTIPTTCGVDGSYAIERLLASDLVATAAVAVEGLTPPSEARHWPDPHYQVWVGVEAHEAETGTILRALMIGMELKLASEAPHEVVFLDGSLTTPLIYFNQALNTAKEAQHLSVTRRLLGGMLDYIRAYCAVLASGRVDRCWVGVPKYTTRQEVGKELGWPDHYDDRGLLSFLLRPGEFTKPRPLQQPSAPWHLNLSSVPADVGDLEDQVLDLLAQIHVTYYKPHPCLPALRLEVGRAVADNRSRLAIVLQGVAHQSAAPAVMEPYPLHMADRMVKHLPKAIPAFRQVTSQRVAESYAGDVDDVFMGLHGYRTESGVQ